MPVSLDRYFQALQAIIAAAADVATSDLTFEIRSPSIGFIRGDIHFADGSLLHLRELLDIQKVAPRLMYVYHYQRVDGTFVFRYDNAKHFADLPSFPHHKHDKDEEHVIAHAAPSFGDVLQEIEALLHPS
jgi:hypothetical protein